MIANAILSHSKILIEQGQRENEEALFNGDDIHDIHDVRMYARAEDGETICNCIGQFVHGNKRTQHITTGRNTDRRIYNDQCAIANSRARNSADKHATSHYGSQPTARSLRW